MPHILLNYITLNFMFEPYFYYYFGALNGIYVLAHISIDDYQLYQNRNRYLNQNVLATCGFEIYFYYILPG